MRVTLLCVHLTNLRILMLRCNELSTLPHEIGMLTALRYELERSTLLVSSDVLF
jgi:hypothetical protein